MEQPLEVMHISTKGRFSAGRETIEKFLDNFAEAMRNGNIETIMSFYSPELVAFDVMPPLEFHNREAYKKIQEECFTNFFMFPVNFTFHHQKIDVSGDLAVANALVNVAGDSIHGGNIDNWLRTTMVMKRNIDGEWKITQFHNSVPVDESMKGLMNLSPDGENESKYH